MKEAKDLYSRLITSCHPDIAMIIFLGIDVGPNSLVRVVPKYKIREEVIIDQEDLPAIRAFGIKDSPGTSKTKKWEKRGGK